jgi:hypothetical protein
VGGFQDNLSKQLKRWPKLSSTPTSALFKNWIFPDLLWYCHMSCEIIQNVALW